MAEKLKIIKVHSQNLPAFSQMLSAGYRRQLQSGMLEAAGAVLLSWLTELSWRNQTSFSNFKGGHPSLFLEREGRRQLVLLCRKSEGHKKGEAYVVN